MKMKKEPIALTEREKLQIGRQVGRKFEELVCKHFNTDRSFLFSTGVNERQFFRFKKGGNPELQTIYLFAKALGVPLKDLFDFDLTKEIKRREDTEGVKEYYKKRYGKRKNRDKE